MADAASTGETRTAPVSAGASGVSFEAVFASLAETPDLEALRGQHPELSDATLRAYFARAAAAPAITDPARGGGDASSAAGKVVRRRKSAHQTELVKTHGLPEADGTLHKGNIFRALLAPLKPGRMLDLGAGKGNFSLTAAGLGWQVTAVDARTIRWPDAGAGDAPSADLIRAIRWIQADVREFPIAPGEYDLICILGLLHHLELADQIALLKRCAGALLLLDTRIAPAIIDRDGDYAGMVVREHGETRDERDLVPTAAWGNALSFRHTEESLLRLVQECGYPQVMPMRPPHRRDYTFYLCLPPVAAPDTGREAARARRRAQRASLGEPREARRNRR